MLATRAPLWFFRLVTNVPLQENKRLPKTFLKHKLIAGLTPTCASSCFAEPYTDVTEDNCRYSISEFYLINLLSVTIHAVMIAGADACKVLFYGALSFSGWTFIETFVANEMYLLCNTENTCFFVLKQLSAHILHGKRFSFCFIWALDLSGV